MSWAVGFDSYWGRDIGYGVPALCDYPGCGAKIDRGLGYVCGGQPYGGEHGCGLYFCGQHLAYGHTDEDGSEVDGEFCERCQDCSGGPWFTATPDVQEWIDWKMTDESWAAWRAEQTGKEKGNGSCNI
jgi:hypothetical protein